MRVVILWLCMCCSILAAAEASTFSLSSLWQSPPPSHPPQIPLRSQIFNVLPRRCSLVENPCARDPDSREYVDCCVPIGLCTDAALACQEPVDSVVYKQCCSHDHQKATPPAYSQPAVILDQSPAPALSPDAFDIEIPQAATPALSPDAFDIESPQATTPALSPDAFDIESPQAATPAPSPDAFDIEIPQSATPAPSPDAFDIEIPAATPAPSPDAFDIESPTAPAPSPTTPRFAQRHENPPQCQKQPSSFTLSPITCWEERISNITCTPLVGFIKTFQDIDVKHVGRSKRCCNVTTVITADCAVPIPNKSHRTTKKCMVYEIPSPPPPPPPPGTVGSSSHSVPPAQSPSLAPAPAPSPFSDCSEHYAYEKKCDSKGRCCVRTEDYGVDCSTGVPRPYSHKHDECYTIGTK